LRDGGGDEKERVLLAMYRAPTSPSLTPALRALLAIGALALAACRAESGHPGSADGAPPDGGSTSRPSPSAPAAKAAASDTGLAPAASAEMTSALGKPVAALTDAVATLTRVIAGYGGQIGVAMMDVTTGEIVAARNDRKPLNPASNAKLFTAAAALSLLHGNYRFETGLYGEQKGSSVAKIVLRGHGDPSLCTRDLWDMVQDLKDAGVRRVEGDVLVDQHFFDGSYVPPAFEQQPNEWAYFRAPVSAVALNENTIKMRVRPTAADAPAAVSFDPPGYVDADGTVKTAAADTPQSVRLDLAPVGQRLVAHLGGFIPESARPIGFARRVDNPALLAGYALKALLLSAGVAVGGDVKPGGESIKRLLVLHRSRPLSDLAYELGKQSNNFYAEMVLKTLGAEKKGRPGSSTDGAGAVERYLRDIGAMEDGVVIKNGSGLYDANRVTASSTVKLLRAAYRDPSISSEFVAQLAIGGVDGTLHRRFSEHKAKRIVRAKTGTLESIAALSGYVLGPPGKGPIAFSIVINNVAGKVTGSRSAIDKCIDEIVRYLWRSPREGETDTVIRR
jgi:serine-type D-Ala-D-Ala carboxypeptidase/endopeptidase (penicillin-binding protein 4)